MAFYTPEETQEILSLRRLEAEGKLDLEACRRAVVLLRQSRQAASLGSTKSRTAKAEAKKPVDAGAILAAFLKTEPAAGLTATAPPKPASTGLPDLGTKL